MGELRRRLVECAVRIDPSLIESALEDAFAAVAPDTVVDQVIVPASKEIGALWAAGACSVAGEHLASAAMRARLARLLQTVNPIGPALPFDDLGEALRARPITAAYLSVTRPAVFRARRAEFERFLEEWGRRIEVFVGGAGVPERDDELEALGAILRPNRPG